MSNIELFVKALQANRRRLFHFTDARNIASIKQVGLWPTRDLGMLGIRPVTGGDAASLVIDQGKGLDAYVRLSFCRRHPMAHVAVERGSIEQLRIMSVCPTVLLRDGVLLSDRVATANDVQIATPNELLHKMDFQATYQYLDWSVPENQARRNAAEKWEALIPSAIAPDLIIGI